MAVAWYGSRLLKAAPPAPLAGRTLGGLEFFPGTLTLLAAAPGTGKTSWLLRIAAEAAAAKLAVEFVEYEHTIAELSLRLARQAEFVAGRRGVSPLEVAAAWAGLALKEASDELDTPRMVEDDAVRAFRLPASGPGLLVVDYLQRIPVPGAPARAAAGRAAVELRKAARRRGWAVVAAAAVRAADYYRPGAALDAVLGDETVVYHADRVLFIYREGVEPGGLRLRVRVVKDRFGPEGVEFGASLAGAFYYPVLDGEETAGEP